jgi:hypothetical protein
LEQAAAKKKGKRHLQTVAHAKLAVCPQTSTTKLHSEPEKQALFDQVLSSFLHAVVGWQFRTMQILARLTMQASEQRLRPHAEKPLGAENGNSG